MLGVRGAGGAGVVYRGGARGGGEEGEGEGGAGPGEHVGPRAHMKKGLFSMYSAFKSRYFHTHMLC
jgi:hypothetical protein